jgi:ketol-acid reductoisomerase
VSGAPSIAANAARAFVLTSTCGVSPTAVAVSVNVTVVAPQAGGDLVFYPAGTGIPTASTISFRAGRTRANNAQVLLSTDGTGRATVKNNAAGALDLVIDVNGYYE